MIVFILKSTICVNFIFLLQFLQNSGFIVPAPRCIAEFDLYFKKNFQDYVQKCTCDTVVFYVSMSVLNLWIPVRNELT